MSELPVGRIEQLTNENRMLWTDLEKAHVKHINLDDQLTIERKTTKRLQARVAELEAVLELFLHISKPGQEPPSDAWLRNLREQVIESSRRALKAGAE